MVSSKQLYKSVKEIKDDKDDAGDSSDLTDSAEDTPIGCTVLLNSPVSASHSPLPPLHCTTAMFLSIVFLTFIDATPVCLIGP